MNSIKLWINDQEVWATANQTVLEAADSSGFFIPRLCAHPSLKPSGSCRLCAVEIEGYRGLPAACSTPVEREMRVRTDSPKVLDFRREMLRLILQEHPRECLGCARNGTCELQRLVEVVGIDFPYAPPVSGQIPTLTAGAYFERDPRLCVRCGRCVRVCHEVRGAGVLVFREVHGRQEVGTAFGRSLEEANCQFCGACVDICPVAALREPLAAHEAEPRESMVEACEGLARIVMDLYRKELPRSWHKSVCPLCSALCPMSFEKTESDDIIQVRPTPGNTVTRGQACVQGRFRLRDHLQSSGRLEKPLMLKDGRYHETTWDSALDLLADRLSTCGPWETAVVTDARLTNEELFALQTFARTILRSNLVGALTPQGHCNLEEIIAKSPASADLRGNLSHLSEAGAVLAIGVNPPATHPIGGTLLRRASLDGTRVIVANPCRIPIGQFADVTLNHAPGTESVLLSGLIHLMLREGRIDPAIQASHAPYLEQLSKALRAHDPETVGEITGVHPEALVEASCLFGGDKPVSVLYGPGLLASSSSRESLRALITLLYVTGSRGKRGGGLIPLFGDANLRGASDLEMTSPLFEFSFEDKKETPASEPAHLGGMVASGQITALYVAMESLDNTAFESLRPFLHNLELVVLHDVIPPAIRGTGEDGSLPHLVLPMATALEKRGTFTCPDGKALEIQPIMDPVGERRSALWVIQELAGRMKANGFARRDEASLLKEIRRQISERTVLVRRTRKAIMGCPRCCTPVKQKASNDENSPPDWKPELVQPFHRQTGEDFPLRAFAKEALESYYLGPVLAPEAREVFHSDADFEMNPADLFRMGLRPGDSVRVSSAREHWEGRLAPSPLVPEGVLVLSSSPPMLPDEQDSSPPILRVRIERTGEAVTCPSEQSQGKR